MSAKKAEPVIRGMLATSARLRSPWPPRAASPRPGRAEYSTRVGDGPRRGSARPAGVLDRSVRAEDAIGVVRESVVDDLVQLDMLGHQALGDEPVLDLGQLLEL